MKNRATLPILPLLLSCVALSACTGKDGATDNADDTVNGDTDDGVITGGPCVSADDVNAPVKLIDKDLTGNHTWTCDTIWVLAQDKLVYVKDGVLTVQAGTTVRGLTGSALIIEKSARIEAVGTADAPIVFTSAQEDPARGDWGGLVLLGRATNNNLGGIGFADGILDPPTYGGSDDEHNCGTLQYVRSEWAGYELRKDSELNGITLYSCGKQSTFDHLEVFMGQDDGFEAYGGIFDVDYLVVVGAADDGVDLDAGNRSRFQYLLIQHDPLAGDNGFELSNNGSDFSAKPYAAPVFCNATVIGAGPTGRDKSKGFALKEGTTATIEASIFTHATQYGAVLTHPETQARAEDGLVSVKNSIFWDDGTPTFATGVDDDPFQDSSPGWTDGQFEDFIMDAANGNLTVDPQLGSLAWQAPDALPAAAEVSSVGATDPRCEPTSFIGAVDPAAEDWTQASWIRYAILPPSP